MNIESPSPQTGNPGTFLFVFDMIFNKCRKMFNIFAVARSSFFEKFLESKEKISRQFSLTRNRSTGHVLTNLF